jgi:hypothetical protein
MSMEESLGAEFELTPWQVLVPSSTGFGVQFNQHLYAGITGAPLRTLPDLERKVLRLEPQLVRLFYNDRQAAASRDKLESFILAADLAQRVGATINITWQSSGVSTPDRSMGRFADVLAYLVTNRELTNLRWATIQNAPNSTKIRPEQNGAMYRSLDRHLAAVGVRDQVRFMGGDLVQNKQRLWFRHMASRLADLIDAYSVHIYWDYWDTAKFRRRLREVKDIVAGLPESGRKPIFVSEFGVRGRGSGRVARPGTYADGTPLGRTTIAAFQQAWFQILAMQLGYAGVVKWDCFYGKYDRTAQAHYLIGPWRDGWPLYPTYHVLDLLTETTEPGWKVVGVKRRPSSARGQQLTALAGPAGDLTIFGLHTAGGRLNDASPRRVSYKIGGLPRRGRFTLVLWNRRGNGRNEVVSAVAADNAGVATISAPLHAVFALTTKLVTRL